MHSIGTECKLSPPSIIPVLSRNYFLWCACRTGPSSPSMSRMLGPPSGSSATCRAASQFCYEEHLCRPYGTTYTGRASRTPAHLPARSRPRNRLPLRSGWAFLETGYPVRQSGTHRAARLREFWLHVHVSLGRSKSSERNDRTNMGCESPQPASAVIQTRKTNVISPFPSSTSGWALTWRPLAQKQLTTKHRPSTSNALVHFALPENTKPPPKPVSPTRCPSMSYALQPSPAFICWLTVAKHHLPVRQACCSRGLRV